MQDCVAAKLNIESCPNPVCISGWGSDWRSNGHENTQTHVNSEELTWALCLFTPDGLENTVLSLAEPQMFDVVLILFPIPGGVSSRGFLMKLKLDGRI